MRPVEPTAPRRLAAVLIVALLGAGLAAASVDDGRDVAALITQLGDADYAVRETAAARLAALGLDASDALLLAVETSTDLEVVLRARALAEALPITAPHDAAAAAAELSGFAAADGAGRIRIMHRLLRLDDDAGIEPLARIVRLERTALGSRIAAALLVREWQRDDPNWPELCRRIAAGVERSDRPAARFLRGVVAQSQAAGADGSGLDAALAAWDAMNRDPADEQAEPGQGRASTDVNRVLDATDTRRIFRRCLLEMLVAAGRHDAALAQAAGLLADCRGTLDEEARVADELAWLAEHGLPEAVDLAADWLGPQPHPLPAYAAALAWRRRPEAEAAERSATLARAAHEALEAAEGGSATIVTAMELARWGAVEWALREYRAVLDDPDTTPAEFAFAGIYCAEFLHEQGRDAEAGRLLATVVSGRDSEAEDMDRVLRLLQHEPETVQARMLYFEACAAVARGDTAGAERLLAESLRVHARDVESLIALHRLVATEPARAAEVADRVAQALAATDDLIAEHPRDAIRLKNEYAWLVVNTRGDVRKATRYSRQTLEHSFDSAGYLDTLAHCRAAAGDLRGALRLQRVALRMDPHSPMLRKNLQRFQAAGAGP